MALARARSSCTDYGLKVCDAGDVARVGNLPGRSVSVPLINRVGPFTRSGLWKINQRRSNRIWRICSRRIDLRRAGFEETFSFFVRQRDEEREFLNDCSQRIFYGLQIGCGQSGVDIL